MLTPKKNGYMRKKIYLDTWLNLKPYDKQAPTDKYYLRLCNEVYDVLRQDDFLISSELKLSESRIQSLACFLTCYFEDLVSGTNVWNSFVRKHQELYGRLIPFYAVDETYVEEEINLEDVMFLIWYFLDLDVLGKFLSPHHIMFFNLGNAVFPIFEKAWEYAPENVYLRSFYEMDPTNTNYYDARRLMDRILYETYLFAVDMLDVLDDDVTALIEIAERDKLAKSMLIDLYKDVRDDVTLGQPTKLLSRYAKDWVMDILGPEHPVTAACREMSPRVKGSFLYKGQDEETVELEYIATGHRFLMTKKSFDYSDELVEVDTIVNIGLVRWEGVWWFSGSYFKLGFNPDYVLDKRNSMDERAKVSFLDEDQEGMKAFFAKQQESFRAFTGGYDMAFMPTPEVEGFINTLMEFYNEGLGLDDQSKEQFDQRLREAGIRLAAKEKKIEDKKTQDSSEIAVVFFNPKKGLEVAMYVYSAFPLPNNPYFDESQTAEHVQTLFLSENTSKELCLYCMDHFGEKLPVFQEGLWKLWMDDIDFLLRYWKRENYHSAHSIVAV